VSRRPVFLLIVLLAALVVPASASAAIDYPDFTSIAGLQLNADAKQEGNILRLTPALPNKRGTAFSTSPLNPAESFENQFAISMHDSTCCVVGTLKPADGMAFVIQGAGLNPGEGLGGSLGYSGIKPSVIVEFDIFYNAPEPLTDHISIIKDGDGGALAHLQCANAGPVPPCTSNLPFPLYGAPVYGWVEYDAATQHLKVWASQSATKPAAPLLDYGISLAPLGSSVYAGFTAATGAHNAVQDVLSWRQGTLNPPIVGPGTGQNEPPKAKKGCGKKKAKGKGKGKGKHKGASSSKKKKKKPKCKKKKRKPPKKR
jgi:hypothetical protein